MLEYAQRVAHIGNLTWDIPADNFFGTREAYRILEVPPGTPIKYMELMDMVHPEDRSFIMGAIKDALNGAIYKVDFRLITRGRKIKHLQAIGERVESREGHAVTLTGTIQDITDLKTMEEKQKNLIDALEFAQRTAHVGYWRWDINTNNFSGTQEAYNIFEIPQGTSMSYSQFLDMVHPEDRPMMVNAIKDGLKGAKYNIEFRIIAANGRTKHVQGIAELEWQKGKAIALSGALQDITEKKERENEQKRLIAELQEALGKIKTLRGPFPICTGCRRIRDDRGAWMKLEKYMEEHSEAVFTQSLCPECEERLFGKNTDTKG